jgi:outer membrane protein
MRTLLTIIFSAITFAGFAQQPVTQKIGYADWDRIFSMMPEAKQIDTELSAHRKQLESQMDAKQKDLQAKYDAFTKLPATTPDAVRTDKQRELEALQESIQKFQQDATTSFENKRNTLLEPVFKKVGDAITAVAKENGFTFIINPQLLQGGDILLYSDEKYDISDMVLKKMGVTAQKPVTPQTQNPK